MSFIGIGEGWHNYHHTFPCDYRAAELGSKYNLTARFIEILHKLNLAYDLKTAPHSIIQSRSIRTGDGTHPVFGNKNKFFNKSTFGKDVSRENHHKESTVINRDKVARG